MWKKKASAAVVILLTGTTCLPSTEDAFNEWHPGLARGGDTRRRREMRSMGHNGAVHLPSEALVGHTGSERIRMLLFGQ
jgi:hypothetical protein